MILVIGLSISGSLLPVIALPGLPPWDPHPQQVPTKVQSHLSMPFVLQSVAGPYAANSVFSDFYSILAHISHNQMEDMTIHFLNSSWSICLLEYLLASQT